MVYSTYLGGPKNDFGGGIAADSAGNTYVTGTLTQDFCDSRTRMCLYNAFVDKINATGSAFVYSTFVENISNNNFASGIAISLDSSGTAYVLGRIGDKANIRFRAFADKLDPSGSALGSPTYLNGNWGAYGYGIATDGAGNAYVTGATRSTNFPTKNPLQAANAGDYDAFVAKIDMRLVTATTLTSSPDPSAYGETVTFTAEVTSSIGAPPDGETVSFMKGTTVLGTGTLSGGSASFATSALPAGTDYIRAVYGGDSDFAGSKSNVVSQAVNKATTTTTLASSQNPSSFGQSVTFTASVTPQFSGTVKGSATFYDGTTALKTVSLSGGAAKFATSTLAAGAHSITATYNGSTSFSGSSASLTQTVN